MITPVFRKAGHVDHYDYGNDGDVEEHYSRVFHRDKPGKIVAIFYGDNHRNDSDAFCDYTNARSVSEWDEEMGDCLWWSFPIQEPPHVGTPLDSDWPGYHTHFTLIPIPTNNVLRRRHG